MVVASFLYQKDGNFTFGRKYAVQTFCGHSTLWHKRNINGMTKDDCKEKKVKQNFLKTNM